MRVQNYKTEFEHVLFGIYKIYHQWFWFKKTFKELITFKDINNLHKDALD